MQIQSLEAAEAVTAILPSTITRIVLTGFMGAGKSTVGRHLADRLGWSFLDLDDAIEALAGLPIPEIFSTLGEAAFRRFESRALARALARPHTILALGGGAPETVGNRLLIEQTPGTVAIFLDAPFSTLFDRCLLQALNPSTTPRPNLADPTLAQARFHLRHPLYRRLAHHTLETSALTPLETIPAILDLLTSERISSH